MSVTFEKMREVDLSPWGFEQKAKVRRMSAQQKAAHKRALAKSNQLKIKTVGDDPAPEMTPSFEEDIIWCLSTLMDAPFPLTMQGIGEQDPELVEYISREAQDINSYFFLKPLENEKDEKAEASGGSTPGESSSGPTLNAHVTLNGR
ncbi:MAG: hypothetical protein A4E30_00329 [Methanomassiliicoccales archaeon PtaB.Bin215]|nr:MAG: hypothetical protein A4E30_00329 [Methanomassiliicoccales archaeon PtaB.Bin215]